MIHVSSYAPRWLQLVMLAGIVLLLMACNTGRSAASPGLGGNQQTSAQTSAPGVPLNVNNVNDLVTYNGTVDVTWHPSEPNGTVIDHYDVVEIHSDNTIGATIASVPASGSLSWKQTGLNLCTYYRFGVKAVTATREESSVAFPLHQAFTSGSFLAPGNEPKTVIVMAMGVNSQIAGGTMYPLSRQSYCTTYDGIIPTTNAPAPLQSLLDGWDNQDYRTHVIDKTGPNGFGAGNRMLDSLASRGAIILPMSYSKDTRLTGPSAAPTFTTAGYTPDNVGNTSPDQVAQWLDDELMSIHKTWHNANIIVVGHSAGGLAVELWWEQHGQYNAQGVVHAFSLDSPINGVANRLCTVFGVSAGCNAAGFGKALSSKLQQLWNDQETHDQEVFSLPNKFYKRSQIFTAVGTQGDTLYDAADGRACVISPGPVCVYQEGDNIGLDSQVFTTEPACNQEYYVMSPSNSCRAVVPPNFIDPCGHPSRYSYETKYGVLWGSLSTHSVVKNCKEVTDKIMTYFPPTSRATATENPLGKVDWTKVVTETDLGCNGPTGPHLGVQIDEKQFADVTGDGTKEAFVAVACVASTSSWPDRLEVFDGASDTAHPRLIATILDYKDGTDERGLRIGSNFGIPQSITISGRTVTVVSHGYAATDPDCCFSLKITDTFTWNGSGFTRGPRSVVQAKAP
jgi:Alpha/beta hydrolase of unknown function (DUF915)